MNLKRLWLLALMASSSMVFATIDLRTTIRDVYVEGSCEQAGVITMSVNGNDFANASTDTPVYIRLRLDHGAELCKTLVWDNTANGISRTRLPIFLPMRFEERLASDAIAAPAETLSIVRWKRGENEIWMKVQFPSGQWIERGAGNFIAPSNTVRVRWDIGIAARTSWQDNSTDFTTAVGGSTFTLANLPSATRDVTALDEDNAVSTLLCTDLTSSNLVPLPAPETESALNFDPVTFDDSTSGVETADDQDDIILGRLISTSFSGDVRIARGFDFGCSGSVLKSSPGPVAAALCLDSATTQQGTFTNGVVCMTNSIDLRVLCGRGWGFHEFSRIFLATESDAKYGFPVFVDDDGDTTDFNTIGNDVGNFVLLADGAIGLSAGSSEGYAAASSVFGIQDGTLLSREARVQFTGPGVTGSFTFSVSATVCQWYQEDPDDVVLAGVVYASNRDQDQVIDSVPFEGKDGEAPGFDQERACDPSLRLAFEFEWNFGSFVPCRSIACTRIFFPYLPKMRDGDGPNAAGFWTGLSYVNQGQQELNVITGHIYEADGAYWTVAFPPLPVRNLDTWLIIYDDNQSSVIFAEADGDTVLVAEPQGNDVIFGDMRSSMFIEGCYFRDGDLAAFGARVDLDGYLLIGNADNTQGAYTARNFEISRFNRNPNQDGDLPVNYTKTGERTFHKVVGFAPNAY